MPAFGLSEDAGPGSAADGIGTAALLSCGMLATAVSA